MAGNLKTHIYCYDDYRRFSDDVKKRFPDDSRYKVVSFQTTMELLSHIEDKNEKALCKVAIIGVHDNKDQMEMIDKLSVKIRNTDPRIGIILLIPADKVEEVKKIVKFNISAYIPVNANSVLRIHNIVKKIISEKSIIRYRKRRNLSLTVLLVFIFLSLLLILISWFRLPQYF